MPLDAPLSENPRWALRIALSGAQNHRCPYCGITMSLDARLPYGSTIDHVVSRCRGGADEWDNLVAACRECNEDKGSQNGLHYAAHQCKRQKRHHPGYRIARERSQNLQP